MKLQRSSAYCPLRTLGCPQWAASHPSTSTLVSCAAGRAKRGGATEMAAASGPDRLPPIPATDWTETQRREAEAIVRGPRGALVSPFVPLLRSPELMGHV